MPAHPRLTQKQQVNIIKEYTEQLTPMAKLAKRYNVTRQAIYKILKKYEVDTSNKKIAVSCSVCNLPLMRHKSRIRKQANHFCSPECYHAFLQANKRPTWRQGSRIARAKVADYFDLQDYHIVHHEDGNQHNNRLDNLQVFANHGDHVRYHRGFEVSPIWNGASL